MARHPFARKLLSATHRQVARSRFMSHAWLGAWSAVLRALPRTQMLDNVANNIASAPWPQLPLGPRWVRLTDDCEVRIHPHPGESDFMALFQRDKPEEGRVCRALQPRMRDYDCIFDIGANVGVFTLFFAKTRRSADVPVYAFEPSRLAFARMQENLALLAAPNVFAVPAAVSDRAGIAEFFEPEGHLPNGSLDASFAGLFTDRVSRTLVPTVDGEAIARLARGFGRILVKVDVEGAESRVLKSLMPLFESSRCDVVAEVLAVGNEGLRDLRLEERFSPQLITASGLQARPALVPDPDHRDYLLVARGHGVS